jgi:hypothetical protein
MVIGDGTLVSILDDDEDDAARGAGGENNGIVLPSRGDWWLVGELNNERPVVDVDVDAVADDELDADAEEADDSLLSRSSNGITADAWPLVPPIYGVDDKSGVEGINNGVLGGANQCWLVLACPIPWDADEAGGEGNGDIIELLDDPAEVGDVRAAPNFGWLRKKYLTLSSAITKWWIRCCFTSSAYATQPLMSEIVVEYGYDGYRRNSIR